MRYIPNILSLIRIPLSLSLLLFVSNYYGFMIPYVDLAIYLMAM